MRDIYCAKCEMLFAVTEAFYDTMRKTEATFYCPAGHGNFYEIPKTSVKVPVVVTINEPEPPERNPDGDAISHLTLVKRETTAPDDDGAMSK